MSKAPLAKSTRPWKVNQPTLSFNFEATVRLVALVEDRTIDRELPLLAAPPITLLPNQPRSTMTWSAILC